MCLLASICELKLFGIPLLQMLAKLEKVYEDIYLFSKTSQLCNELYQGTVRMKAPNET